MFYISKRGVAAHAVVVLYATFSGQTIVIPSGGVENLFATHTLEACNDICMGVAKDVPNVQRTRGGGWWSVNRIHS